MRKHIFAYTPPGFAPPYLSVNREEDGEIIVTVRAQAPVGAPQPIAAIEVPLLELVKLVACVAEFTSAKLRELPEDDAKMLLLQAKADLA